MRSNLEPVELPLKGKMPTLDLFSVQTKRIRLSFIVFVERFALSQTPEAVATVTQLMLI